MALPPPPTARGSSRTARLLCILAAFGLLVAACGGDDDTDASPASGSAETDAGPATDTSTAIDPSTATDTGTASDAVSFPVTIAHKYGEATVDAEPERVVSVGFTDQDFLLSLGVVPVGIREWYGDQPFATWPWAQDALGAAEPVVLDSAEINFEQVASLQPDLIVGVSSGMTEEEYQTLSAIAPTLTQTDDDVDYGLPWQDGMTMIGQAVGKAELAETVIDDVEVQFADVVAAHPSFEGEATFSYVISESEVGAYASSDSRSRLLTMLGFTIPAEIDELAGDLFYSQFSLERIDELDRDLLVWIGVNGEIEDQVRANPVHASLDVVNRGAEIFLSELQGAAAGFSSPLSLPYLLETFVPQLEAAVDGDPATEVPAA